MFEKIFIGVARKMRKDNKNSISEIGAGSYFTINFKSI